MTDSIAQIHTSCAEDFDRPVGFGDRFWGDGLSSTPGTYRDEAHIDGWKCNFSKKAQID